MSTIRIKISGTVQGVGFRPFVWRVAHQFNLVGNIKNTAEGVAIEVQGSDEDLDGFVSLIRREPPAHCVIREFKSETIEQADFKRFTIIDSSDSEEHTTTVVADIASCPECIAEVFDPSNRRYLYPFTNCTHCGPRYSIIEGLPYDRGNTSMKSFSMCPLCQPEYEDPSNRRFHAQPNACPNCGPQVELLSSKGHLVVSKAEALHKAVELLKHGEILAVKGIGGFRLMVDATNANAVRTLRQRKHRPHKPFAVLFPSVEAIEEFCYVTKPESTLLSSAYAPIVLLKKKMKFQGIASSVAPYNPYLGAMLASMPLEHILLKEAGVPLVATSGNLSDEPICIDNNEAISRLGKIADYFLVHDRPIVRHLDDSVFCVIDHKPYPLRIARGFAPLAIDLGSEANAILAVGAHQKSSIALGVKDLGMISQHIGDLETKDSLEAFEKTIKSLRQLYTTELKQIACDLHPDYASSQYAIASGVPTVGIQHHFAHVASCMAESKITESVLGVCWDGTGLGVDGTIWGGEFITTDGASFERVGHLRTFRLAGGEKAIQQPDRCALGILFELCKGHWDQFADLDAVRNLPSHKLDVITHMLERSLNAPTTSSMGRLFDAVASLTGTCRLPSFEGQAAMSLEYAVDGSIERSLYPYGITHANQGMAIEIIDWENIILGVIEDLRASCPVSLISAKFHATLVDIIIKMARHAKKHKVILTGGCFQNKLLLQRAIERLRDEGFEPIWHTKVPCNDGGIALGQLYAAARRSVCA